MIDLLTYLFTVGGFGILGCMMVEIADRKSN